MKRVVILTPNPDDMAYGGRWSEVCDRMVGPLAAEGFSVDRRAWIEPVEGLAGYDLILPLTTWGYHRDYDLWVAMTDAWGFAGLPIRNPPGVLRWNADKRYLGRLSEKGAPIVPTVYVDRVAEANLHDLARRFACERLIVKPQVSASAYKTLRVAPGEALVDPPEGPAMVQPYLEAVEGQGEISLIYFDGRLSHAIRKVAAEGDFRTQPEWGGHIEAYAPEEDVLYVAGKILKAIDEPLLYARVDLVRDGHGDPRLMELELVEPDLYLGFDPEEGRGFARAVRRAVEGTPSA